MRLWDLREGLPVSVARPAAGTVRAVALDDAAMFAGGSDHVLRLWESSLYSGSSSPSSSSTDGGGGGGGEGALMDIDFDARGGGGGGGSDDAPLFDLSGRERVLAGHIGPITSLSLTSSALYSGSWCVAWLLPIALPALLCLLTACNASWPALRFSAC